MVQVSAAALYRGVSVTGKGNRTSDHLQAMLALLCSVGYGLFPKGSMAKAEMISDFSYKGSIAKPI